MELHIPSSIMKSAQYRELQQLVQNQNGDDVRDLACPHCRYGSWTLSQNMCLRNRRCAATETGFFFRSRHIDARGLWAQSTLNYSRAVAAIKAYRAPETALDFIARIDGIPYKYPPNGGAARWDGIVLAAQKPIDLAVSSVCCGDPVEEYLRFIEGACAYYGKHLFVKQHPKISANIAQQIEAIAKRYDCMVGYCDHSILDHCRWVLVYNSTIAVDCWIHDVPIAQYAPGYFAKTSAVTYTAGEYPDDVEDTREMAQKVLDFLLWKYCYCEDLPPQKMLRLFRAFARARVDELFPLPEELSYAAQYEECLARRS